jgi:hypothetical protein
MPKPSEYAVAGKRGRERETEEGRRKERDLEATTWKEEDE